MSVNLSNIFINLIQNQKEKEEKYDIWKNSIYKDLTRLQMNNIGIIGENFIQEICNNCDIHSKINGAKTKLRGGGYGDGFILNKSIEIKTSHQGSKNTTFQHELGETPWLANYMIFIDITPDNIYMTLFKNFDEEFYKSGKKCDPYFSTKSITWRKKTGAFKLDTTIKINEDNIINNNCIKITHQEINKEKIKEFILIKLQ